MTQRITHHVHHFLLALGVAALAGCGGGDTSTSDVTSPPTDNTEPKTPAENAETRIAAALSTGDARLLKAEDSTALLDKAITEVKRQQLRQSAAVRSIYGNDNKAIDLALDVKNNSLSIDAASSTQATPFIVADGGLSIAAISTSGSGRALAYGANVLDWMAGTTTQQQHVPLFTRAFTWLMTGDGSASLPAKIKYATAGYSAATVKSYITRIGKESEAVTCAIADPANTCWSDADLLVFGAGTPANPDLKALVQRYLAAGKAVMYMHATWSNSDGGRQILAGMNMTMAGYPGNYFASAEKTSVASGSTIETALARADRLTKLEASLQLLKQTTPAVDLTSNTASATPFALMLSELGTLQESGQNIFAGDNNLLLQRLLVLWADTQRPTLKYGQVSRKSPTEFLRTYATDAFLWFPRSAGSTATAGQGDYMPATAQSIAPSTQWEELQITLPQASGITLIGRGALPGKGVQVEVLDASNAGTLGLQTSYLRIWGDPLTNNKDDYPHPLRPGSFTIPLNPQGITDFNSPNGGPLMLRYTGATPNAVVKLRVKGVTHYAHFDYAAGMSDSDEDAASRALATGNYGWQTTKVVGGEIQQIMAFAKKAIGNATPEYYANTLIHDGLLNSNHIANGYNSVSMTDNVKSLCAAFSWTCDGRVHDAPKVQHFVGWIADCGYFCAGDPIDAYTGIALGWGFAHEMGHNTVQRVMRIVPNGIHGCWSECDNDILSNTTAMRVFDTLGVEISSPQSLDHEGLYKAIVDNRSEDRSDEDMVDDMRYRLWTNGKHGTMQAVHFQLAFLFTKARCAQAKPSASCALDYFSLLTKGDRLVAQAFTPATASKYAMGRYANNTIRNHELLYVLSSKIIGQDLRKIFAMYGIALSETALGSVADLNLPVAPRSFYALATGKHNALSTGQWIDLESSTPAWPY